MCVTLHVRTALCEKQLPFAERIAQLHAEEFETNLSRRQSLASADMLRAGLPLSEPRRDLQSPSVRSLAPVRHASTPSLGRRSSREASGSMRPQSSGDLRNTQPLGLTKSALTQDRNRWAALDPPNPPISACALQAPTADVHH